LAISAALAGGARSRKLAPAGAIQRGDAMTHDEIQEAKRDPVLLAGCVEYNLAKLDKWHQIECWCWQNYGDSEGDVHDLLPLLPVLRERVANAGHLMITEDWLEPSEN